MGGYHPHRDSSPYFLNHIGKALDTLLGDYDNFLLIGDFNCTQEDKCMIDFCETHNLENLIKVPTCFKNRKNSFQNTMAKEIIALYKNFNETNFRTDLYNALLSYNKQTLKYDDFKNILMTVLNSHAPTKQRILRGNKQPFMNKTLSQAPSCIGLN